MKIHSAAYNVSRDIYFVTTGALIFGVAINMFLLPGEIILGGFTGIATMLNILFGLHPGAILLILNLPVAIVNVKFYGLSFIVKAFLGILASSAACELLVFLPRITDRLLCAFAGGISMGCACGLLFIRGYTTGGTDLVAWLLKAKFGRISMGTLILLSDALVIIASAFFIRGTGGFILSVLSVTVCSISLDFIMSKAHKKGSRHAP